MKALLIDRQELFRSAVRDLVAATNRYETIIEAASTSEFVTHATSHDDIGLVIVYPNSIDLSIQDCLHLAQRLVPDAEIILFSDDMPLQYHELPAGVSLLQRTAGVEDVLSVLGFYPANDRMPMAVSQRSLLSQRFVRKSFDGAYPTEDEVEICDNLSKRQREIMAMVAEGLANKEIAARLEIAEGTVKAHIHSVFKTLGVTNRTQAVVRYGGALRAAS